MVVKSRRFNSFSFISVTCVERLASLRKNMMLTRESMKAKLVTSARNVKRNFPPKKTLGNILPQLTPTTIKPLAARHAQNHSRIVIS